MSAMLLFEASWSMMSAIPDPLPSLYIPFMKSVSPSVLTTGKVSPAAGNPVTADAGIVSEITAATISSSVGLTSAPTSTLSILFSRSSVRALATASGELLVPLPVSVLFVATVCNPLGGMLARASAESCQFSPVHLISADGRSRVRVKDSEG